MTRRRIAAAAAIAAAVGAAGCGGASAQQAGTTGTLPCADGAAKPVTPAALAGALRNVGLTVKRDKFCSTPEAVAQVSNVALPISVAKQEAVSRREGDVLCLLESTPTYRRVVRVDFDAKASLVTVLNVTCNVYPHGANEKTQVNRVAGALRTLARGHK